MSDTPTAGIPMAERDVIATMLCGQSPIIMMYAMDAGLEFVDFAHEPYRWMFLMSQLSTRYDALDDADAVINRARSMPYDDACRRIDSIIHARFPAISAWEHRWLAGASARVPGSRTVLDVLGGAQAVLAHAVDPVSTREAKAALLEIRSEAKRRVWCDALQRCVDQTIASATDMETTSHISLAHLTLLRATWVVEPSAETPPPRVHVERTGGGPRRKPPVRPGRSG